MKTLEPMPLEVKEKVGKAIGRIASGVFVLAMDRDGEKEGLLASWVNQAAFDPPMIMVAVKKERRVLDLMAVGSRFTLNVLSKKNMDIFKNFAKPFKEGVDRFEGLALQPNSKHGPVFSDSVAYMACMTRTMVECGDHVVVVGEIFDGENLNADAEPMVHLRNNGFQY